jgi:hypothetical protein
MNQNNHATVAQVQSHIPSSAGECRSRQGSNCPKNGARLPIGLKTRDQDLDPQEAVEVCRAPLPLGHVPLDRCRMPPTPREVCTGEGKLNRSFRHEENGIARRDIHRDLYDPERLGQGRS